MNNYQDSKNLLSSNSNDESNTETIQEIIRKRKKIKNKIKKYQIKITDLEYKLIELDRKESDLNQKEIIPRYNIS